MQKINFYKIQEEIPIRDAVKKMDKGGIGFIVCVNQNDKVTGILTDGDFRRAILRGIDLQQQVCSIMNKNFYFLEFDYKEKEAKKIFINTVASRIPVLQDKKLIDIIIKDVYNKKRLHSSLGYRPPDEYESLFSENDSQECIMAKTISVYSEGFTSLL